MTRVIIENDDKVVWDEYISEAEAGLFVQEFNSLAEVKKIKSLKARIILRSSQETPRARDLFDHFSKDLAKGQLTAV